MTRRSERGARETIQLSSRQMAQRMAGECVQSEQDNIDQQDKRAHPNSKPILKKESANCIPPKEHKIEKREIKKPAVKILQDKRKRSLAAVAPLACFAHRASRRVQKERTIVGLPIVVAGRTKPQR